jgi:uncharacterized protein HemX
MSAALSLLQVVAGLFGWRLSPFATGAVIAAALAAGLAGAALYLVHLGADQARSECQADQLRDENARLGAELAEKQRALALINGIAARDAKRAAEAEIQLRDNQANINATPQNPAECFPRAAAGRVRRVR